MLQLCGVILVAQLVACGGGKPGPKKPEVVLPVAIAGENQNVNVGDVVQLDAEGSSSGQGLLQYRWLVKVQPAGSEIVIEDSNNINAHFVALKQGSYQIELTVTDDAEYSATAQINIVVDIVDQPNVEPPVAVVGQDQSVKVGDVVQLNAQGSYASEGSLQYRWLVKIQPNGSDVAIENSNRVNAHFLAQEPGSYQVELTVTDDTELSATAQTNIIVTAVEQNSVPVARITTSNQNANTGQAIRLSAQTSSDGDNDALIYHWEISDKPVDSTAQLSDVAAVETDFSAETPGTYQVELTVSDTQSSHQVSVELTVSNSNNPPLANAGVDQSVAVGFPVLLDGNGSTDNEGDTLSYQWTLTSKPDNSMVVWQDRTLATPIFTPHTAGDYVISLRVYDGHSYSDFDQLVLTATTNNIPLAVAGDNRQVERGSTVRLNGSASSDPDGDSLTYAWEFVDIPAGHHTTLYFADTATPEFDTYQEETYVIKLVVNDGYQDSIADSITVTSTLNHQPTATIDGAQEQYATVGPLVTFNGANSSDPGGEPLTYHWTLTTSDTSDATLQSDDQSTTAFVPDEVGTYLLMLIVNDGTQDSTYTLVRLTVHPDEAMVGVSISGELLDQGGEPLAGVVIYKANSYDVTTSDLQGNFNLSLQVPLSSIDSVDLIFANQDLIPKTTVTLNGLSEENTSLDIGQRELPALQDIDLYIWACDDYAQETVDIRFEMTAPQSADTTFEFNQSLEFTPRTLPYRQRLPATATINISSQAANVTVGLSETSFMHEYQSVGSAVGIKFIDVCNKN